MESVSILQLTSIAAIVSASIFLTRVAKQALASVPIASRLPVFVYTATIAGVLTYIASSITHTLEGQTGVLIADAIINGALASGIREWFQAGLRPLADTAVAREARQEADLAKRIRSIVLPIVLAASLASACGGGHTVQLPAPVQIAPSESSVQSVRAISIRMADVFEDVGYLVRDGRRATEAAHKAGLVSDAHMTMIDRAVTAVGPKVVAIMDLASTVTSEPELLRTVQSAVSILDDLILRLGVGDASMQRIMRAINLALEPAYAFLGGRDHE